MQVINKESALKSEKIYEIKSYEANANAEVKPFVLLHHMEDAAYQNAEKIHIGYNDIHSQKFTWFVIKYHMVFEKLPKAWDKIKISTWPSENNGILCRRDFKIYTEDGEIIGRVASLWALINTENKKIVNPRKNLQFPDLEPLYALDTDFEKLTKIEKISYRKVIEISFDDIDLNGHVNNSNYIAWACATLPYEFLTENSIKEIKIHYKKEATYGIKIISYALQDKCADITQHTLINEETKDELANIKIRWDKRN